MTGHKSKSKSAKSRNKLSLLLIRNGYAISSNDIVLNRTNKIFKYFLSVN